uniref:Uncharacterized protein n=1 Tax=Avena sativa TaxID=4498 RepID=A0ACD5U1X4_AVESA
MAALKKSTSSLCFMAALMVVIMATALLSSCHARKEMDHEPAAVFAVPAPCYSKYFPNCTDDKCKKFCAVKASRRCPEPTATTSPAAAVQLVKDPQRTEEE